MTASRLKPHSSVKRDDRRPTCTVIVVTSTPHTPLRSSETNLHKHQETSGNLRAGSTTPPACHICFCIKAPPQLSTNFLMTPALVIQQPAYVRHSPRTLVSQSLATNPLTARHIRLCEAPKQISTSTRKPTATFERVRPQEGFISTTIDARMKQLPCPTQKNQPHFTLNDSGSNDCDKNPIMPVGLSSISSKSHHSSPWMWTTTDPPLQGPIAYPETSGLKKSKHDSGSVVQGLIRAKDPFALPNAAPRLMLRLFTMQTHHGE